MPRSLSPMRRRRGFMLADAIVATVLLAIGLSVGIGLAARAVRSQASGADMAVAAMLADEQLNLVLARGPDDYARRYETEGRCDPPYEEFRYEVEVRSPGGSSGAAIDPYEVAVTIAWPGATLRGRGGSEREFAVQTFIAPRRGDDPDPERQPETVVERLQ